EFRILMKVAFHAELESPIVAFTIKNLQGLELAGTNTMIERASVERVHPGESYVFTFRQKMDLQGGEYLFSFGCTGFHEGDFRVYHRLYDLINVTVFSEKNAVGIYDMNSTVTVQKV
ncbi:MAG: Wzt carbohydrate-binding domain-containing protein, partial [Lachnospiraceae bacterium]|nr:Wzt carbohydrate-binding domain-containing protein [Lachnospiraceae bacterium]